MKMRNTFLPLIIAGMAMTLLLAAASTSFAANPPPPGSHFQGPAIRGQFVFEDDGSGGLVASFNGTCGAGDIMVPSTPVLGLYFPEDVSEENLKENIIDYFLISPYAYDCEPHLKDSTPDGLLIIQIKSYLNAGATIVADVIMLWIVPK